MKKRFLPGMLLASFLAMGSVYADTTEKPYKFWAPDSDRSSQHATIILKTIYYCTSDKQAYDAQFRVGIEIAEGHSWGGIQNDLKKFSQEILWPRFQTDVAQDAMRRFNDQYGQLTYKEFRDYAEKENIKNGNPGLNKGFPEVELIIDLYKSTQTGEDIGEPFMQNLRVLTPTSFTIVSAKFMQHSGPEKYKAFKLGDEHPSCFLN